MFRDEVLEQIFAHKEMRYVPIGYQSTVVTVIGEVIEKLRGENPYAKLSDILSDTDAYIIERLQSADD